MAILAQQAREDIGTGNCRKDEGKEANASFSEQQSRRIVGLEWEREDTDSGIRNFSYNVFIWIFIWHFLAYLLRKLDPRDINWLLHDTLDIKAILAPPGIECRLKRESSPRSSPGNLHFMESDRAGCFIKLTLLDM